MWLLFILTDIDECELETYPCHSNANCTDTDGSFNCTCREGFEGDGFNCTGIIINIPNTISMVTMHGCYVLLQIFLSVKEGWISVIQMQLAQTQLEVITAPVILDSLETDSAAQVCEG